MNMLCSVLLPTRMRVNKLCRAVKSVFDTADNPQRVEVILRVHADDLDTIKAIPELLPLGTVRVAIGPKVEYGKVATCFNEAAALATGQWHMQFNDDTYIIGKGWDTQLEDMDVSTGPMVQPELNQLGPSGYRHDYSCPFMWYPWWVWEDYYERNLPDPADAAIWHWSSSLLANTPSGNIDPRGKPKDNAKFLSGITVFHDRDEADCKRIAT